MKSAFARAVAIERRSLPARDEISFVMDVPPPVNRLFANVPGKGRVKTREYREWIKTAGWEVAAQRPGYISGPVKVDIILPLNDRADVDSRIKASLDLAVRLNIIDDDAARVIHGLNLSYDNTPKMRVRIRRVA